MNNHNLAKKIKDVSQLKGSFLLRSGVTSETYFDKYQFESDPSILKEVAEGMAPLIPSDTEILAGLELGGIPLAVMLGQILGLKVAFIRKKAKEYGTQRFAEGPELGGRKIVLVEDVVTSGSAILDATNALRHQGIDVSLAVCVIDRESGGKENLAAIDVELKALFSATQIMG